MIILRRKVFSTPLNRAEQIAEKAKNCNLSPEEYKKFAFDVSKGKISSNQIDWRSKQNLHQAARNIEYQHKRPIFSKGKDRARAKDRKELNKYFGFDTKEGKGSWVDKEYIEDRNRHQAAKIKFDKKLESSEARTKLQRRADKLRRERKNVLQKRNLLIGAGVAGGTALAGAGLYAYKKYKNRKRREDEV